MRPRPSHLTLLGLGVAAGTIFKRNVHRQQAQHRAREALMQHVPTFGSNTPPEKWGSLAHAQYLLAGLLGTHQGDEQVTRLSLDPQIQRLMSAWPARPKTRHYEQLSDHLQRLRAGEGL